VFERALIEAAFTQKVARVQNAQGGFFAATGNHRQDSFTFFNKEHRISRITLGVDSLLTLESKRSLTLDNVIEKRFEAEEFFFANCLHFNFLGSTSRFCPS